MLIPSCHRGTIRFLVVFLSSSLIAAAYPPAPGVLVHGVARDPYGWAFRAEDRVVVRVRKDGEVIAQAVVDDAVRPGENFRVLLPASTDPLLPPYTPQAVRPGDELSFEVVVDGMVLPVLGIDRSLREIDGPAQRLYIDFSTGLDSDGDGLPDEWEFWQLSAAGIDPWDDHYSLDTFGSGDFDGDGLSDFDEYVAGTFAGLLSDSFQLIPIELTADGWLRCEFLAVVDKTYELQSSGDLLGWAARSGAFEGKRDKMQTFWYAEETEMVTVEIPKEEADSGFFRIVVR